MTLQEDFEALSADYHALKVEWETAKQNLLGAALITPGTLRFGSNVSQLDHSGITVKTDAGIDPAIYFLPTFLTNPRLFTKGSSFNGTNSATTASLQHLSANDDATALVTTFASQSGGDATALLRMQLEAGANASGRIDFEALETLAFAVFRLRDTVIQWESTTDPGTGIADGMLWYNTTDNKLRARIDGVTVTLGGGSMAAGVITDPFKWAGGAGYEYWIVAGSGDLITASGATNLSGLDSYGWTTTSLVASNGGTADFLSSGDLDPNRISTDASADVLRSPTIFGTYDHALQAAEFLGHQPTTLTLEVFGRFATSSANETGSFFGMVGAAETDAAGAASAGAIISDGTNFRLRSAAGNDAGALIDTNFHRWKIVWTGSTTEWFIDNVSQGTITLDNDIWPVGFTMRAATTNRLTFAWARVQYS